MIIGLKSALAMLKRKKLQSFLIGLTIMLTALLIYIGLSLMNQDSPFDKMYSRAKASENLILLNPKVHDVDDIQKWLDDYEIVEGVGRNNVYQCNIDFMKNDKKTSNTIFLTEFVELGNQDIIYVNNNEKAISPKDNEIYIPYNFASNNQLQIGDTLKTYVNNHTYNLTVAKIIVDPHFNNEFMSPVRCYVAPDFFEKNNIIFNATLLVIKYKTYTPENEKVLKKEFDTYMLDNMQPLFIEYEVIESAYSMISNIIASALLLISIFMFIIVIFIIRATIRNQILQQYKTIGVRKVIGYSSRQIRAMFLYMYMIIGLIVSSIGAFLGLPIRIALEERLNSDLQVGVKTGLDWYIVITILIILGLLLIFVSLASNKANRIKPIQAIKYGMPENKLKRTNFRVDTFSKAPLSIVLAIKQILMDKRKTIVSIISIMIITFVSLTISTITGSMSDARHFAKSLMGLTQGDVSITYLAEEPLQKVINNLESIENVESVVYVNMNMSDNTLSKDGTENISVLGTIIYGNPKNDLIILGKGRQPINNNEIVISSPVVKKTGKTIGDYINIKQEDGNKKYLITGIYDSVTNSGSSYVAIENEIVDEQNSQNGFYWLYMSKKNVILKEIETNIIDVLGDDATVTEFDSGSLQIINTTKLLPAVSNILLTIFLIVCGVIIFNWTIIDITKSVKVYGILKAYGFSNRELRGLLITKSVVLTMIGVFAAYILCFLTIDKVMSLMFAVTPFSTLKLPVVFSHNQGILIALLYFVIALLATLIPTKRIASISPKNLITE